VTSIGDRPHSSISHPSCPRPRPATAQISGSWSPSARLISLHRRRLAPLLPWRGRLAHSVRSSVALPHFLHIAAPVRPRFFSLCPDFFPKSHTLLSSSRSRRPPTSPFPRARTARVTSMRTDRRAAPHAGLLPVENSCSLRRPSLSIFLLSLAPCAVLRRPPRMLRYVSTTTVLQDRDLKHRVGNFKI
jgi:hypothetical protein